MCKHQVGSLGSGKGYLSFDDEGRHAGHAEPSCHVLRLDDLVRSFVAGQKRLDFLAGKTRAGGHLREDSTITDVVALGEVGRKECFGHAVLIAVTLREPDQPMRVEGVGRAPDQVMPKSDSFLGTDGADLSIQFL